jgi:hypothetical protein
MDGSQYREASPEVRTLAGANAALRADQACLEKEIEELGDLTVQLEQKIRSLQVVVTLLLAITLGLTVGLTTSMTGSGVQAALGAATGVFFAVILTSITVLSYIRR